MRRPPPYVYLILFLTLALPGALMLHLLRAGIVQETRAQEAAKPRKLPAPPPRPRHATELRGPASDGGRVIVRRNRTWLWVWVEYAHTSDCDPAVTAWNGVLHDEAPRGVRRDGRFELRGSFTDRWNVPDVRRALPHGLDGALDRVTYRIAGRFDGEGRVHGSFERDDDVFHDGSPAIRCRYRSTWTAAR